LLPRKFRLCKNKDFRIIYRSGKSISNQFLVLYIRKNNINETRIGFSISKKIGKANERNLLKRQLREITRKFLPLIKSGYDLVFVARQRIKGLDYGNLEKSVKLLLDKGKILK
jgi:ribonuclease P protein component